MYGKYFMHIYSRAKLPIKKNVAKTDSITAQQEQTQQCERENHCEDNRGNEQTIEPLITTADVTEQPKQAGTAVSITSESTGNITNSHHSVTTGSDTKADSQAASQVYIQAANQKENKVDDYYWYPHNLFDDSE